MPRIIVPRRGECPAATVRERAADQNHRRSVTDAVESNRSAVLREHFFHEGRSHVGYRFKCRVIAHTITPRMSGRVSDNRARLRSSRSVDACRASDGIGKLELRST